MTRGGGRGSHPLPPAAAAAAEEEEEDVRSRRRRGGSLREQFVDETRKCCRHAAARLARLRDVRRVRLAGFVLLALVLGPDYPDDDAEQQ